MRHNVPSPSHLRTALLLSLTLLLGACGTGEPPATGGPGPGVGDQAPAAPSGLTANAAASGITLDWKDNTESDLAGYRVSRADSATGPFTLLTSEPLTISTYTDTAAPTGRASYYRVVAVDRAGNVSASSAVVS